MTKVPSVALVGEDTAHAVLMGVLLRATLTAAARDAGHEWLIENILHDPEFMGEEDLSDVVPRLRYTSSIYGLSDAAKPLLIDGRPLKLRGFVAGHPQRPAAHKWRTLLTRVLSHEPTVTLVAVDTDGHPEHLDGLRQVVAFFIALDADRVIVVAAPHQDAECWFVAGFDPDNGRESEALRAVTNALRFDPRLYSERLTAHPNDAATDAKRVLLKLLLLSDDDRSAPLSLEEMRDHAGRLLGDLDRLKARGEGNGLVGFLAELDARVVPKLVPGW